MLSLERIFQQERLLQTTTRLNDQAFEALLPSFAEAYEQSCLKPDVKRQRAVGCGWKIALRTPSEKLFYILCYCKCYPTFDLLSGLFGFDHSCAWNWGHELLPVLEHPLGSKRALPEGKLRSLEELLERFADVEAVILDGAERPALYPQDSEQQQEHDSGKKKRHTRKLITGSKRKKQVILIIPARGGRIQNKWQLEEVGLVEYVSDEAPIARALGFQGLQTGFDSVYLPHRKPKEKELVEQQKQENRQFSRRRVVCEHFHAGIKRYSVVTDVYRNHVPDFDDRSMFNPAGLWNFYLNAA